MSLMVTHIYFAEKYYPKLYSDESHREKFIIGNLLPDIRYIDKVESQKSHGGPFPVDMKRIGTANDIESGVLFHTVVDHVWSYEGYETKILGNFSEDIARRTTLKLFTDYLLYPRIENMSGVIKSLDNTYPEENAFVEDPESIPRWHKILQRYLSKRVGASEIVEFQKLMNLPDEVGQKIVKFFETFQSDPSIKDRIMTEVNMFDTIYQLYKENPYKLAEKYRTILKY